MAKWTEVVIKFKIKLSDVILISLLRMKHGFSCTNNTLQVFYVFDKNIWHDFVLEVINKHWLELICAVGQRRASIVQNNRNTFSVINTLHIQSVENDAYNQSFLESIRNYWFWRKDKYAERGDTRKRDVETDGNGERNGREVTDQWDSHQCSPPFS